MIQNSIRVLAVSVALLFSVSSSAQINNDVNQYMLYQPLVNFASASSYKEISSALYYRNQWVGFEGAPINYALQVALPLKNKNTTLGIRVIRDEIGVRRNDIVSFNYARKVRLSEGSYLSFSLSPKVGFLKEARTELTAADELDPLTQVNVQKNGLVNAEFGTYYYRNNFYFGGVLPNLLRNNIIGSNNVETYFAFNKLEWFIHSGYQWEARSKSNSKDYLNVSGLLKSDVGASLHGEFNLMYQINNKKIGLGVSYRTSKAIVGMVRLSMFNQLSLSYSYQYNYSNLARYQNGSHELMLVFEKRTNRNLVRLNVPRF